jgi:hypothetical protein
VFQGLKIRSVFFKITKIWWDRLGAISKNWHCSPKKLVQVIKKSILFIKKISTVYQKTMQKLDLDTSDFFHYVKFLNTDFVFGSVVLAATDRWCLRSGLVSSAAKGIPLLLCVLQPC